MGKGRVVGIGLDGLSFTLATRLQDEGVMPNFARLAAHGAMRRIDSVYPTVSNVAWSAFQTGKNPGDFGIYGFVELDYQLGLRIPSSTDLQSRTIWEYLSDRGKRSVALSVPQTYPPRPVDGILVGGFLAPALEKAVHPPTALPVLQELRYAIDIDPMAARESLDTCKEQLLDVFEGRRRTLFHMLANEAWDLLFLHVMETDRLGHFMWRFHDAGDSADHRFVVDFYRTIDDMLGEVAAQLPTDATLLIMSDHGLCGIRSEVELNWWLQSERLLRLDGSPAEGFAALSPASKAVALVPGRLHLLTPEFWERGTVTRAEYEGLRADVAERLRQLRHPESGHVLCRQVLTREEAFWGEHLERAPDLIVDPADGYDLKASLAADSLLTTSPLSGMHTYHDAMLYVGGVELDSRPARVYDVMPTLLELLGIAVPDDLDGQSLLAR